MKKLLIFVILLLPLCGCYVDYGPGYNGYYGDEVYGPGNIVFDGPPDVIVLPYTNNVYVIPDIDIDLYFWDGWWWRLWEGRWYRSSYYNRGWNQYYNVPSFYVGIDLGWRKYYRERNWHGQRWNYERIRSQQLQKNWKSWNNDQHWEKKKNWGIQSTKPVLQRPEVQPERVYRTQRQETKPERDYRHQNSDTKPKFDSRPQRPEAQPGRNYKHKPQSGEDKPAQRMISKSQDKFKLNDANQLEKQEKEEAEKQVRKDYQQRW